MLDRRNTLVQGFDDEFVVPHSRYSHVEQKDISKVHKLHTVVISDTAGAYIIATKDHRQVFVTGHPEYDQMTLADEYVTVRAFLRALYHVVALQLCDV